MPLIPLSSTKQKHSHEGLQKPALTSAVIRAINLLCPHNTVLLTPSFRHPQYLYSIAFHQQQLSSIICLTKLAILYHIFSRVRHVESLSYPSSSSASPDLTRLHDGHSLLSDSTQTERIFHMQYLHMPFQVTLDSPLLNDTISVRNRIDLLPVPPSSPRACSDRRNSMTSNRR